jgi:hypothetical protein
VGVSVGVGLGGTLVAVDVGVGATVAVAASVSARDAGVCVAAGTVEGSVVGAGRQAEIQIRIAIKIVPCLIMALPRSFDIGTS